MQDEIERLLLEAQRVRLTERRTEARHPFVRPVMVYRNDQAGIQAFSKDISGMGMSLIIGESVTPGSIAILQIHCLQGDPVCIKSEARWCDGLGKDWFLTGWKFISRSNPPSAAPRIIRRVDPGL